MFLAHSIRLRDPWQCEASDNDWVCWTRVFHRPTGLEPDDSLWLVIAGLPEHAVVTVNGQKFEPRATGVPPVDSPTEPPSFDLTSVLTDDNRIELRVPSPLPPASSLQPPAFPFDARLAIIGRS